MKPADTVLEFLRRINRRDVDGLAEMMAEDHVFIDSLGRAARGREQMRAGWRGYYAMCPDYWVAHDLVLAEGNTVAVFGEAGGTIAANGSLAAENRWRVPAAWRATVAEGLIQEWRVYADNQPVAEIIARAKAAAR
jgi:ketosteroid isomerase-like protein